MEKENFELNLLLFLLLNRIVRSSLLKSYPQETKSRISNFLTELNQNTIKSLLREKFPYVSENLMQEFLYFVSKAAKSFTNQISSSSFSFPSSDLLDIESKIISAIRNRDLNFINSALHVGSSKVSMLSGGKKPSERK